MASKQTSNTIVNLNNSTISQPGNYYPNWKETDRIDFICLEKGLLLFIHVYQTSESVLATEMLFWDHQLCVNMITTGKCSKSSNECRREHQTSYRQTNLCPKWYTDNRCTFGDKCEDSHRFEGIPNEHRYIRTETDANIFKLIRFIRNFAGHYNEYVIHDQQELYKDVLLVMKKNAMNQMITQENLLYELEKPFNVPKVFFDRHINYSAAWYRPTANRCDIDFNQLSPAFVTYLNRIFVEYYQGRLKSRGAKPAWS